MIVAVPSATGVMVTVLPLTLTVATPVLLLDAVSVAEDGFTVTLKEAIEEYALYEAL